VPAPKWKANSEQPAKNFFISFIVELEATEKCLQFNLFIMDILWLLGVRKFLLYFWQYTKRIAYECRQTSAEVNRTFLWEVARKKLMSRNLNAQKLSSFSISWNHFLLVRIWIYSATKCWY
jgi:hypothetical protein